jgi:hypothetical protein
MKRYFDPQASRWIEVPDDDEPFVSRETEGPLSDSASIMRAEESRRDLIDRDGDDWAARDVAKQLAKLRRAAETDTGVASDAVMKSVAANGGVVEFHREESPPLTKLDHIKGRLRRAVRAAMAEERNRGPGPLTEETRRACVKAVGDFLAEGVRRHDPRMARDFERHAAMMGDEEEARRGAQAADA